MVEQEPLEVPLGGEEAAALTLPVCCLRCKLCCRRCEGLLLRHRRRVLGAGGGFSGCPPAQLAELPLDRGCGGLGSLPWGHPRSQPERGALSPPLSHVSASRMRASSSPFPLPLARSFSPSLLSFFVSSHLSFSHQAIFGDEFLTVNMVGTMVHLMS